MTNDSHAGNSSCGLMTDKDLKCRCVAARAASKSASPLRGVAGAEGRKLGLTAAESFAYRALGWSVTVDTEQVLIGAAGYGNSLVLAGNTAIVGFSAPADQARIAWAATIFRTGGSNSQSTRTDISMCDFDSWTMSIWYGCIIAAISLPAAAQDDIRLLRDRAADERPMLLVLGTAHLDNPGRDVVNTRVDDVLRPARQAEINHVVAQLASYRPTHIAVEWPANEQAALDARYRGYREGKYQLGRGEEEQIGLRLAAKLHLARVHAVDWLGEPPGNDRDYDWVAYGQTHGQKAQVSALLDPRRSVGIVPLDTQTIGKWLLEINVPATLAANHRNYFDWAGIGDTEHQPGANWVGQWYARNLRIFTNLVRTAGRPQDRMLVVYGHGHAYLLRQFATESGAFHVVDVDSVLKEM